MLSTLMWATRLVPSLGELDVPWLVSPGGRVVVPRDLARELMETCAVEVACSPPLRPGEGGTGRSTLPRRGTPSAPPLLPLVSLLWSWPRVIRSRASLRSHLSWLTRSSPSPRPRRPWFLRKNKAWADVAKVYA